MRRIIFNYDIVIHNKKQDDRLTEIILLDKLLKKDIWNKEGRKVAEYEFDLYYLKKRMHLDYHDLKIRIGNSGDMGIALKDFYPLKIRFEKSISYYFFTEKGKYNIYNKEGHDIDLILPPCLG